MVTLIHTLMYSIATLSYNRMGAGGEGGEENLRYAPFERAVILGVIGEIGNGDGKMTRPVGEAWICDFGANGGLHKKSNRIE